MINYVQDAGGLRPDTSAGAEAAAVWTDLEAPEADVLARLSAQYGMQLPTREDQQEIEQSSRLYLDNGVPVMTVLLPARSGEGEMQIEPASFVLFDDRLVTIRHHDPRPFTTFPGKAGTTPHGVVTPDAVMIGLLEEIIDRLADITEQSGREIDRTAKRIFGSETLRTEEYRTALREIGRADGRVMQLRESLMTIERMLGFLGPVLEGRKTGKPLRGALKSQYRDVRTIAEQAGVPAAKDILHAGCGAGPHQHRAERHHQDLLGRGGGLSAAHAGGVDLRDELCPHARIAMAAGLSACNRGDGAFGGCAALVFSAAWLALTGKEAEQT